MRRILVTGGAGFIGSHTSDLLLANSYEVRVLDCLQPRVHPNGKPDYLPPEVDFLLGDVRDRSAWERALEGVQYVFHLAAYQDYMPDFSTFIHVNTYSTALMYEIIVERRLPVEKIVLASSQSVYGEGKYECPQHGFFFPGARPLDRLRRGLWEHACPQCGQDLRPVPFDESVVNPHTAYAISKYAEELTGIELGKRYGIPTVAMRYSIVQGPRNSLYNAYSGVCRIFTQRLLNHKPPVVYEDGKQLRDYVHVLDAAAANLLALQRPECNYKAFNIGGTRPVSVLQFARILGEKCGKEIPPVLSKEFRVGDTRHTVSDSTALRRLAWVPRFSVEKIAEDYLHWARQQSSVPDNYEEAAQEMKQRAVLRSVSVSG